MVFALIAVLIQLLFTCGAGWLLWKAWRRLTAIDARAGVLIGAGMAIRALIAQAMFWISYLRLPIARSLQDGDGFWTLAVDGRAYFGYASHLLAHGWTAVALVDKTLPSPAFLQLLAVFQLLFGGAASVGALLNLFAYLGACAAILRLGRTTDGQVSTPALIALAALSFGPAVIIWSVQPLKDPFFIFAVTAFVAACTLWQEAWRGRFLTRHFVQPLLLMLVIMYAVVGIRWYFGLLLWIASLPFFAVATWRSDRRVLAAVTNAIVFLALAEVIIFAGGPYVKGRLAFPFGSAEENRPPSLAATVVESRQNFDKTHVNTMITSGAALQKVDEAPVRSETKPASPVQIAHKNRAVEPPPEPIAPPQTGSLVIEPVALTTSPPSNALTPMASGAEPPAAVVAPATHPKESSIRTSVPAPAAHPSEQKSAVTKEPAKPASLPSQIIPREQSAEAVVVVPKNVPAVVKSPQLTAPPPPAAKTVRAVTKRVHHPAPPPIQKSAEKTPVVQTPVVAAAPPARKIAVSAPPPEVLPQSTFTRVIAGLTAVVLPHFIGERLGLIHIGGGRGLWAIVETDTLVFDALLLLVLYYAFGTMARGAWRNPSFWLVAITTAGITILLAYTISNFGTLFRHRAMIFIGLCLMLVVARETPRDPLRSDVSSES